MKIILLLFTSWLLSGQDHDLHLSNMQIKYNTEEKALQISLNVFIDDIEGALSERGIDNLKILTDKESPQADSILMDYFIDHLILEVDGLAVTPSFIGKESSEDFMAAWCYLEVLDVDPFYTLTISNKILLDHFDDQRNIVIVKRDNNRLASFIFEEYKQVEDIDFR